MSMHWPEVQEGICWPVWFKNTMARLERGEARTYPDPGMERLKSFAVEVIAAYNWPASP